MKTIVKTLLFVSSVSFICSGCGVFMAAKQPSKKNTAIFRVGTPRSLLLAEFGLPMAGEVRKDGRKYEIFAFTQGYSAGAKAGRAVFHGVADVVTWGLWEIIATPTEGIFNGTEMAYEVRYDEDDLVDQVIPLKKE